jgi:hypothetical protein
MSPRNHQVNPRSPDESQKSDLERKQGQQLAWRRRQSDVLYFDHQSRMSDGGGYYGEHGRDRQSRERYAHWEGRNSGSGYGGGYAAGYGGGSGGRGGRGRRN